MTNLDLIDQGLGWTAARIANVSPNALDAPTPCGLWALRDLLDHTLGVLTTITEALEAAGAGSAAATDCGSGSAPWADAIADLAARNRVAWVAPGIMDRTFELPFGTMSAPVLASVTLLEGVVHGWDIGQSTGERVAIPEEFAGAVLAFARPALADMDRADNFAADLGVGDTLSDQLVAFLGRKP